VSTDFLTAAFWLPHTTASVSSDELLRRAGALNITADTSPYGRPHDRWLCDWGGLRCETYRTTPNAYHHVLLLYFLQSSLIEIASETGEIDRLLTAFRDACTALRPEVAMVATHVWQADPDHILALEWMVLAKEANSLADERFGLMYLDDELAQYWTPDPMRDARKHVPTSHGRLCFATGGPQPWI
jgi:hypothetical protein